jgi:DNA-binding NarL/FixJ family response regulator
MRAARPLVHTAAIKNCLTAPILSGMNADLQAVDAEKTLGCFKSAPLPRLLRILVIDDHGVVREGLAALFDKEAGMKVIGTGATGAEAVRGVRRLNPDVVVMDLMLPDMSGIDAAQHIIKEFPLARIVALSVHQTCEHVFRALRAGIRGYVAKTDDGDDLIRAVMAASKGDRYVSSAIRPLFPAGSLENSIKERVRQSQQSRARDLAACHRRMQQRRHRTATVVVAQDHRHVSKPADD